MGYLRPKSGLRKKNAYFGVEPKMAINHEFYFHNFHVDKNYEIGYTVKMYKFILQSSYFDI